MQRIMWIDGVKGCFKIKVNGLKGIMTRDELVKAYQRGGYPSKKGDGGALYALFEVEIDGDH